MKQKLLLKQFPETRLAQRINILEILEMSDIQLPNREKERNENENRKGKDLFSIIEELSSIHMNTIPTNKYRLCQFVLLNRIIWNKHCDNNANETE